MRNELFIIVVGFSLALGACSGEDTASTQPPRQVDLVGTYDVTYSAIVGYKSDSVYFSITGNNYAASHFGPDPKFCYSEGTVTDYGSTQVNLTPAVVLGSSCDSLRIPEGTFDADYRSRGDTIVFVRKIPVVAPYIGDSVFTLTLVPVAQP